MPNKHIDVRLVRFGVVRGKESRNPDIEENQNDEGEEPQPHLPPDTSTLGHA